MASDPTSAIVGQPPNNQFDKDMIEGFWRFITKTYGPAPPGHPNPPIIPMKPIPGSSNQDKTAEVYGVTLAMFFIVLFLTVGRLLTRALKPELKWGSDDWAMIPAALLLLGYNIYTAAVVKNEGLGHHVWEITYHQFQNFFEGLQVGGILFYTGMGVLKISITLFNKRLAGLTSKRWQWYLNGLLVIYTLYCLTSILTQTIMCEPVWILMRFNVLGQRTEKSHCLNSDQVSRSLGIIHASFDFFLLPIPLIILRQTRMTMIQRIKLTMLFSIGLLSFIASIVRATIYTHRTASKDVTYTILDIKTWTWVDMLAGVLCANLPVLNALLPPRWRKGIWSRRVSPSSSNHSGSPTRSPTVRSKAAGKHDYGIGVKEVDSSSSEGSSSGRGRAIEEEDDWTGSGSISDDDVFNADGTRPDVETKRKRMERSRRADLEGYHQSTYAISEAVKH